MRGVRAGLWGAALGVVVGLCGACGKGGGASDASGVATSDVGASAGDAGAGAGDAGAVAGNAGAGASDAGAGASDAGAGAGDAGASASDAGAGDAVAVVEPVFLRGKVELPGGIPLSLHLKIEPGVPSAGADAAAPVATGTVDIPLQHVRAAALSEVSLSEAALAFSLVPPGATPTQAARFSAAREAGSTRYVGTLSQGGQTFPFSAERVRGPDDFVVRRPQTPSAPFPYSTETLKVTAGDATLGCTLSRPSAPGKVPAVVLFTGSGAQDRDETIFEHKPFLVLADALTRGGLAVLRCDDRGVGESTGDLNKADLGTFVADGKALVAALKKRPDIDAKKVGALGHSEGGMVVAALVDARQLAFAVTLSGPALSGREILVRQNRDLVLGQGATAEEADKVAAVVDQYFAAIVDKVPSDELKRRAEAMIDATEVIAKAHGQDPAQTGGPRESQIASTLAMSENPWLASFLAAHAAPQLARAKGIPVLALFGEKDSQVRAVENAQALRAAAEKKKDLTVEVVADANHLFQKATTGAVSEYADLEETMMPSVIERIVGWAREAAGLARR